MYTKKITYTDYRGVKRTENFQFNFTEQELAEWAESVDGGLSEHINKIVEADDDKKLIELFKSLILKSYGVVSEDGRRFMKGGEITKAFEECPAFSAFFMECVNNSTTASEFINGLIEPFSREDENSK